MASLDDILTTQKNGVIALNNLALTTSYQYAFNKGQILKSGSLGTGGYSSLFTVPSTKQMTVTDIEICNTSAVGAVFYISLVPSGGTAGASNALFYNAPIPAYTTIQWTGNQVIAPSGSIQAYASSNAVTIMVSGGPGS